MGLSIEDEGELFDIVDKNDNILKTGLEESEIHINNDITRVVTIYVFDKEGKIYIAQRSPQKLVDPLKFEAPAHGKVSSGESYEEAARRETMEELGVELIDLEEVDNFYYSFDTNVGKRQHCKKLFIGKLDTLPVISDKGIYALKSFDSVETYLEYYDKNINLFSDAVKFDIERLRKKYM